MAEQPRRSRRGHMDRAATRRRQCGTTSFAIHRASKPSLLPLELAGLLPALLYMRLLAQRARLASGGLLGSGRIAFVVRPGASWAGRRCDLHRSGQRMGRTRADRWCCQARASPHASAPAPARPPSQPRRAAPPARRRCTAAAAMADAAAAAAAAKPDPAAAKARALDMLDFINAAWTPYHAVEEAARRLSAAGFEHIAEKDPWELKPGAGTGRRGRGDAASEGAAGGERRVVPRGRGPRAGARGRATPSPRSPLAPGPGRRGAGAALRWLAPRPRTYTTHTYN
jgi:hypothetical protein